MEISYRILSQNLVVTIHVKTAVEYHKLINLVEVDSEYPTDWGEFIHKLKGEIDFTHSDKDIELFIGKTSVIMILKFGTISYPRGLVDSINNYLNPVKSGDDPHIYALFTESQKILS
ncbi:hypothetical protein EKK58_07965 [Candidatus Dependentiae bacterium]|nr:MAG: hypothetical protein EKK58_07965 [Candidatus Dependentiae bacterium]